MATLKYCSVCGKPVGKVKFEGIDVYEPYYTEANNLRLCSKCYNKDPYEIIEELLEEIDELEDKINELEDRLENQQ